MEKKPSSGGDPLCIGPRLSNRILSIESLRKELRDFLREPRIGVEDKVSWMAKAKEVEFGLQAPRPLCRFLLLAAAHNARPDETLPGLLTDTDVVEGADLDFFNHRNWVGQKYATVEHIAPNTDPGQGWERRIYARPVAGCRASPAPFPQLLPQSPPWTAHADRWGQGLENQTQPRLGLGQPALLSLYQQFEAAYAFFGDGQGDGRATNSRRPSGRRPGFEELVKRGLVNL